MFKKENADARGATGARHAALRQRLIEAAEATIATHGLADIKARELAAQAGCATGAIYSVFADLDELILEVNARTMQALDGALQQAMGHQPAASPRTILVLLAEAYMDFALAHRRRWDALFMHRMPAGRAAPDWFWQFQGGLFARVEAPVAALRPGLAGAERALLARSVFSAVHGVVVLGLDQRLVAIDASGLRRQLRLIVEALTVGLALPEDTSPTTSTPVGPMATRRVRNKPLRS